MSMHSRLLVVALALVAATGASPAVNGDEARAEALVALGRALFFDPRLSRDRTMSCATCHDPQSAFTDVRDNGVAGGASLGNDGTTIGDRNAPTLTYTAAVPEFGQDPDGRYRGGLFHDGRAATMEDQARQPLMNPAEMGLDSASMLRDRIRESPGYVDAFTALFGAAALSKPGESLDHAVTAIAAYERSPELSSFDSKYDRYLRGEAVLTTEEELGRRLFFSPLINCNRCHLLDEREDREREIFTNHEYFNIGVPANARVRAANGRGTEHVDPGLAGNPQVSSSAERGKYRVPSLRNVAVTRPYMHNGVFTELATAIAFYNQFLVDSEASRTNPETGAAWAPPEVPETVDAERLGAGQPLTEQRVAQIEAFLQTLTDRRYEALLGR
jgi:cytochrome c peroxidase